MAVPFICMIALALVSPRVSDANRVGPPGPLAALVSTATRESHPIPVRSRRIASHLSWTFSDDLREAVGVKAGIVSTGEGGIEESISAALPVPELLSLVTRVRTADEPWWRSSEPGGRWVLYRAVTRAHRDWLARRAGQWESGLVSLDPVDVLQSSWHEEGGPWHWRQWDWIRPVSPKTTHP